MLNLLLRDLRLCSQRGLGLVHQIGKPGGVLDGDVGEDFAVQFNAGLLEAVDELRIAEVVQLGGGGDADNPERTELALLLLAAGVGKLQAALDGFLGCLVELGLRKEVSTSSLKNLFAAVLRVPARESLPAGPCSRFHVWP